MANKLRSKVPPPPDPEQLKEEKLETVEIKEVVKDERTFKIIGSICLLIAVFLFIAIASYCATWDEDQDKVMQFGVKIFATNDVQVANLLGVLGAFIAHQLVYNGFGLASFFICTFFFVIGVNNLFDKRVFSIARNVKYVLVGLLVISVALAFVGNKASFSFGGAVGEMLSAWLVKWIGNFGTAALLTTAVFTYCIWRFNPTFKWPEKKIKPFVPTDNQSHAANEEDFNFEPENESLYHEEEKATNTTSAYTPSTNKLKGDGKLGDIQLEDENPLPQFDIIEKEEVEEIPIASTPPPTQPITEIPNASIAELPAVTKIYVQQPAVANVNVQNTEKDNLVDELLVADEPELTAPEDDPFKLEIKEIPVDDIEEEAAILTAAQKVLAMPNYEPTLDLSNYKYPSIDLLEAHGSEKIIQDPEELEANKNQIINTLKNYDIAIQRISATVGPTVTLYEIVPAPGVRISRIKNLEDDIALSLAALGIRIIAPIPGKGTIGIEVPNVNKKVVSMKTLLMSEKFISSNFSLPIAIGKKIDNDNFIVDLATMPHLLVAGATGQGKSVGINALLVSLLYKKHPSQLKFVLVDPKKVELSLYRVIEKHFLAKLPGEDDAIITDTKKVINTLNALCIEMDNRYDLLKEAGCRNIKEYNEKFVKRKLNPQKGHQFLPFIVLVVDEFADLIMTAGKEVEMPIARLAQLARAVGIHLIIATQRPSVNIITGTIKANFPARIAFKVSSKIDSRTILDAGGAEQLIGKGDMLVSYNGEITRVQCAFVDTPEVEAVCDFIGDQLGYPDAFLLPEYVDEKELESKDFDVNDKDPLFEDAARLIVQNQVGSTSLIQRRMKLGYNRAGRLMDQLEGAGVVGPNQGSKAREVVIKTEAELQMLLDTIL